MAAGGRLAGLPRAIRISGDHAMQARPPRRRGGPVARRRGRAARGGLRPVRGEHVRRRPGLIWVFEVWPTKGDHDASLQLPETRAVIAAAMPMLTGEFT